MAQRILRRYLIGSDKIKMPSLAFHKPAMPALFKAWDSIQIRI
jgi:hypothetical protein